MTPDPLSKPDAANESAAVRLIEQGIAHKAANDLDAAEQCHLSAIALAPSLPRAHLNLGNVRLAKGDPAAAIQAYEQALALDPDYAFAHFNIGNARQRLKQHMAAVEAYARAIALKPDFADGQVAMGIAYHSLGRFDDATACFRIALALRPDLGPVYGNLGVALRGTGDFRGALQAFRDQVRICPQDGQAYGNLGVALHDVGDFLDALQAFRDQVRVAPDDGQAYCNLGAALQRHGEWEQALHAFREAVRLRPDLSRALCLAYEAANYLCDWSRRAQDERDLVDRVQGGVGSIFNMPLLNLGSGDSESAELQRQAAFNFASEFVQEVAAVPKRDFSVHQRGKRLRIGYLSCDVYEHPVMQLYRGVLDCHDPQRVAVSLYSYGSVRDALTASIRASCEAFRDLHGISDIAAAEVIAGDKIDILVDLTGFTNEFRGGITALRPAPVIANWLGYPGTLGHRQLADYIISDRVISPPEKAAYYSETLALLPHCYQPNDSQRKVGSLPTRAAVGLPEQGMVFCSFNQTVKFTPQMMDIWCSLLRAAPSSVLWLLDHQEPSRENLRREVVRRGVDSQRLVFAPRIPLEQHLGRLQLADLALDTYPYTSHTTGSDALRAGVPLLTRMGETFASRVAGSLLHAIGVPELITYSADEYLSRAISLAKNPQSLVDFRAKIRKQRDTSPLFDTARFTRNLEQLFEQMWLQYELGNRALISLADATLTNLP